MVPLILFGLAGIAIIAYSEGQKSGVDATPRQLPPPPPPTPAPRAPAPTHKPGSPPPPTTAANILERKRLIVARGYQAALDRRKKRHPGEKLQLSMSAVVSQFKAKGVPLGTPDPRDPFWKQTEKQIADRLATVVNTIAGYYT